MTLQERLRASAKELVRLLEEDVANIERFKEEARETAAAHIGKDKPVERFFISWITASPLCAGSLENSMIKNTGRSLTQSADQALYVSSLVSDGNGLSTPVVPIVHQVGEACREQMLKNVQRESLQTKRLGGQYKKLFAQITGQKHQTEHSDQEFSGNCR